MSESFWVIPAEVKEKSPLTMLREQASALSEATGGLLRGEVSTRKWLNGLEISLNVVVPALGNYELELLTYRQPPLMYPGRLVSLLDDQPGINLPAAVGEGFEIHREQEFADVLKFILASEKMQKTIAALLAQIREP